jgi:hypothetical protein
MRRIALLGLFALLPGCQYTAYYVADPTVGAGGFFADTHTWHLNRNLPKAEAENEKLVEGEPVKIEALLPEPGEVWPGPPPAIPTLRDVESLTNMEVLPPAAIPTGPAPPVFPQNAPNTQQDVPPPGTTQKTP